MQCTQFRYEEKLYFCGRFRMRKSLFMRIVTEVTAANSFFVKKKMLLARWVSLRFTNARLL